MKICEVCKTPILDGQTRCPNCGWKAKKSSPVIKEVIKKPKEVIEKKPKGKIKLEIIVSVLATVVSLGISFSQYINIRDDSDSKVYEGEWIGDSFETLELNYPELVDDVKKYYDYLNTNLDGIPFTQEYMVYKERYDTLGDRYVEFVFEAGMFIESEEIHIEVKKEVTSLSVKLTLFSDHEASPNELHPDILQAYSKISDESLDEIQKSVQLAIDEYESQEYKPQMDIGDFGFNVHCYIDQENQYRTALNLVKNLELK